MTPPGILKQLLMPAMSESNDSRVWSYRVCFSFDIDFENYSYDLLGANSNWICSWLTIEPFTHFLEGWEYPIYNKIITYWGYGYFSWFNDKPIFNFLKTKKTKIVDENNMSLKLRMVSKSMTKQIKTHMEQKHERKMVWSECHNNGAPIS